MCLLPGLQMLFSFSREEPLHGVEEPEKSVLPEFSLDAIRSDRFQKGVESWFSHNLGYRPTLVRTDNQINYSVFNEISASYASPLVVGKSNALFEKLYIDSYAGRWFVPDKVLERSARKLEDLQNGLKERGIGFLLLITPSKASIYPELIPDAYREPDFDYEKASNYHRFIPMLNRHRINVLDGHATLEQMKSAQATPLFAKGGTHWTENTACIVSKQMFAQLQEITGKPQPSVQCDPTEIRPIPDPFDRDLADLSNVLDPSPFYEQLPYPVAAPGFAAQSGQSRPKMLFIGGSFLWSVFHYLDEQQTYETRDMFYYFSRRFHYPGDHVEPINKGKLDWENDVFRNDIIVLEVNESSIHQLGSGFIAPALKALGKDSKNGKTR